MSDYRELLMGCGQSREKRLHIPGTTKEWKNLTTLDNNPDHNPDQCWDLRKLPLPIEDNTFDEIHAYEVLEHLYPQGDYKSFFAEFTEYHRILKPGGYMAITVPAPNSIWALGDPSHTRVMPGENFLFLSQQFYADNVGNNACSDFRYLYTADFNVAIQPEEQTTLILLQAIK